jgi:hypothetical protein
MVNSKESTERRTKRLKGQLPPLEFFDIDDALSKAGLTDVDQSLIHTHNHHIICIQKSI